MLLLYRLTPWLAHTKVGGFWSKKRAIFLSPTWNSWLATFTRLGEADVKFAAKLDKVLYSFIE
jgi:hypothetical protein